MAAHSLTIVWQRTVIGGETAPCDFVATLGGKAVGRIFRIPHHPNKGCWQWSLTLSVPWVQYSAISPHGGMTQTKAEAVEEIRQVVARLHEAKRQSDIQRGVPGEGLFADICSIGSCTKPGYGSPRLCYAHAQSKRAVSE